MVPIAMQPSIHDAFFKEMLSRPEHAASLLQQILPARIVARLHFASLAPCSGSYVDDALKERHSDLLFSVLLEGRPALIYLLFEHQSSIDDRMSFRLLRYEVRIWERWLRDNPGAPKLPVIPRSHASRCGACGTRASPGSWWTASAPGWSWCARFGAPRTEWLRWC